MSTEIFPSDFRQWPKLTSSTTSRTAAATASTGTAAASSSPMATTNDWEILDDAISTTDHHPTHTVLQGSNTGNNGDANNSTLSDFVVIAEDHEIITKPVLDVSQQTNNGSATTKRKSFRHSVSSPLFSAVTADNNSHTEINRQNVGDDDDDDNFTLLSDVASVWTTATTSVAGKSSTTTTMSVSFRDAILLSSPNTDCSYRTAAMSSIQVHTPSQQQKQRSRIQPKIVVVQSPSVTTTTATRTTNTKQLRRCSKSTGDLLRLPTAYEDSNMDLLSQSARSDHRRTYYHDDVDNDDVGDYYGTNNSNNNHSDIYYDHKAMGAVSHSNGLKLRPDEIKRRDMILYKKKDQQRRQQQHQASSSLNSKSKSKK